MTQSNLTNLSLQVMTSLALLISLPAWALKSDREKPTTIDANQMTYSEKENINIFSGDVLLTRGSLVIRGNKLTLTQQPDGTQTALVEGKPANFRQQRDNEGPEILMIRGEANRIEFDGNKEIVILRGKATIQKTSNNQVTEEISGETITYEQPTEFLTVDSAGKNSQGKPNRVQAVIKPVSPPSTGNANDGK